jgi:hypothetical protein
MMKLNVALQDVTRFSLFIIALALTGSLLAANGRTYSTTKASVEVHDPNAKRNPIRSVVAPTWLAADLKKKMNLKRGQALVLSCKGDFPAGWIADDLIRPSGQFNREFFINDQTTVLQLCNQYQDNMRERNPRLFK